MPKRAEDAESIALDDLPSHVVELLRRARETGQPVAITENGKTAAVLVSPTDFDRLDERSRFMSAVAEGLEDAQAGRLIEHDDLIRELDETFGPLDRAG